MITALWFVLACSDYSVALPDPTPPAQPPGSDDEDGQGDPPDWADCESGYLGQYYNLTDDHPDFGADLAEVDPEAVDWWSEDYRVWQGWEPSLDFGGNWWPVDEGLAGDPGGFSARWTAWLRAHEDTTLEITLGGATDAWAILDGQIIAEQIGQGAFEPEIWTLDLDAGQYPLDLRSAHRLDAESGFRFRVISGDAQICYPELSE